MQSVKSADQTLSAEDEQRLRSQLHEVGEDFDECVEQYHQFHEKNTPLSLRESLETIVGMRVHSKQAHQMCVDLFGDLSSYFETLGMTVQDACRKIGRPLDGDVMAEKLESGGLYSMPLADLAFLVSAIDNAALVIDLPADFPD